MSAEQVHTAVETGSAVNIVECAMCVVPPAPTADWFQARVLFDISAFSAVNKLVCYLKKIFIL